MDLNKKSMVETFNYWKSYGLSDGGAFRQVVYHIDNNAKDKNWIDERNMAIQTFIDILGQEAFKQEVQFLLESEAGIRPESRKYKFILKAAQISGVEIHDRVGREMDLNYS